MKLYEIEQTIYEILENGFTVDEETGEILFDETNLTELQMARDTKLENIALYVKALDAETAAIKAEEKALAERRKSKEAKIIRLMDMLKYYTDGKKFETSKVAITYKKSNSVEIEDINKLPEQYIKVKTEMSADKVALKKAIKDGEIINGAVLVEKQNMQIK